MAPGRVKIRKPLVGLGQGILNWLGKLRLEKIYLSNNYKDCQNVEVFSQGPLEMICVSVLHPEHQITSVKSCLIDTDPVLDCSSNVVWSSPISLVMSY